MKTNKIVYNFSVRFANLVSCVYLFEDASTKKKVPSILRESTHYTNNEPILNLVVVNSILPAVSY